MPYLDNEIDVGALIREANRKEREKWNKVIEYCKKKGIEQERLVRDAFDYVKEYNKKYYAQMNDPSIPKAQRDAIRFQKTLEEIFKRVFL
jgi:hypothetical protein